MFWNGCRNLIPFFIEELLFTITLTKPIKTDLNLGLFKASVEAKIQFIINVCRILGKELHYPLYKREGQQSCK